MIRSATAAEPEHNQAMENIRGWTRRRFALSGTAAVLVAELRCTVPGCPPQETAVAFWDEGEKRHQFKLLKPVAEIDEDDFAWLIRTLDAPEGAAWDCC